MWLLESWRLRRKADRVLLAAWINAAVTALAVFMAPDRTIAIVIGCFWVSLTSLVAVCVAQRLDKDAKPVLRSSTD